MHCPALPHDSETKHTVAMRADRLGLPRRTVLCLMRMADAKFLSDTRSLCVPRHCSMLDRCLKQQTSLPSGRSLNTLKKLLQMTMLSTMARRTMTDAPRKGRVLYDVSSCLKSQGCHWIPLEYLLLFFRRIPVLFLLLPSPVTLSLLSSFLRAGPFS